MGLDACAIVGLHQNNKNNVTRNKMERLDLTAECYAMYNDMQYNAHVKSSPYQCSSL